MKNQQVNWFIRDTKLCDAGKHIEQIRRPYGFFFQCKLFLWRRLFHSFFPLEIKINKKYFKLTKWRFEGRSSKCGSGDCDLPRGQHESLLSASSGKGKQKNVVVKIVQDCEKKRINSEESYSNKQMTNSEMEEKK